MHPRPTEFLEAYRRAIPSHVETVALPHGVAIGDATHESAVLWTRTEGPAEVHAEYAREPTFSAPSRTAPARTTAASDYTAKVRLTDLDPGTTYYYRVWALRGRGAAWLFEAPATTTGGTFDTAPRPGTTERVSFVWSGDTYGQGREPPYQVCRRMAALDPDFFHYQGDTIYADDPTPALPDGDPGSVADYRAKYRELRERGTHLRDLLSTTSVVAIWDDHEVGNDWSGTTDERLPAGRQAFLEYWPVDEHRTVTGDDDGRLYRSFRWGDALELFVLDTRQYRDDNEAPDGPEKTMLGDEQKRWLKDGLAGTDATFAVVSSSTSLSSVSSAPEARDSWASGESETGFEHELDELVAFVREEVESTVVWLSGDRHFARVVSYDLDFDGTPEMYEALATPIGAAPRDPAEEPPDATFSPTVHYEEGGKYERGEFYNFGHVEVTGRTLTIRIYDKVGDCRCTATIDADDGADPLTVRVSDAPDPGVGGGVRDRVRRLLDRVATR